MALTPFNLRHRLLPNVVPALLAGFCSWLTFTLVGETPLVRASGLALIIVGVALMLTRWGALVGIAGGLALAFSPAFWSQTGGSESLSLPLVLGALALAAIGALALGRLSRRTTLAISVGIAIFAVLFITIIGTPRSLRLTTLIAAWLLFVLTEALMLTNPRPEEAPPTDLRRRHRFSILLLLVIGVLNDPLFTLMLPAIGLGLFLTKARLPLWYWLVFAAVSAFGLYGIVDDYVSSTWWSYSAAQAEAAGIRGPWLLADGWRVSSRWIMLFSLVIEQFTPLGLALGVFGLARLARWYPPLGIVTLVAYATYFVFGLMYFGRDAAVLLLPLLMIQVFWLAYGVYALGQWLQRGYAPLKPVTRWLAPSLFALLPLLLFLRLLGGTGVM